MYFKSVTGPNYIQGPTSGDYFETDPAWEAFNPEDFRSQPLEEELKDGMCVRLIRTGQFYYVSQRYLFCPNDHMTYFSWDKERSLHYPDFDLEFPEVGSYCLSPELGVVRIDSVRLQMDTKLSFRLRVTNGLGADSYHYVDYPVTWPKVEAEVVPPPAIPEEGYLVLTAQGVSNPSLEFGTKWVWVPNRQCWVSFSGVHTYLSDTTTSMPNGMFGFTSSVEKEVKFSDPFLANFTTNLEGDFYASKHDTVLASWLEKQLPEHLFCIASRRFQISGFRRARQNPANLAIYLNQKQKDTEKLQSLRPGRAFRSILPELSDAELERLVDAFRRDFPVMNYTVKRGREASDFVHMYEHERAPMQNPYTTYARKSLANSCMSGKYWSSNESPVQVYATGDWEAVWAETEAGKIAARMVVWHPPEDHKLHGVPQQGPVYGICEQSMDLLQETVGGKLFEESDWEGATIKAIQKNGNYLGPYLDQCQALTLEGDYFVLSNDNTDDAEFVAHQTNGYLEERSPRATCSCCGYRCDEDDLSYDINDGLICDSCRDNDYFYCDLSNNYYPQSDYTQVEIHYSHGRYTDSAEQGVAEDQGFVYCEGEDKWWQESETVLLADGTYLSTKEFDKGDYAECAITGGLYSTDDMYLYGDEGTCIHKDQYNSDIHFIDEDGIVQIKEAA